MSSFRIDLNDVGTDDFFETPDLDFNNNNNNNNNKDVKENNRFSNNSMMNSNGQSSPYKGLLQSATNQKIELEQTNHTLLQAQKESKRLTKQNDQLHQQLSKTNQRFTETKKALLQMMETLSCRERELYAAETKWRGVVDQERKSIEDQRLGLRNEVQLQQNVRRQIRNELALEYEEEVKSLVKEKEECENNYYTMKQEYEINNVKYQVAIETMKKEVKETKAQRDEGIAELQNALSKYMDDNQDGINRLDQLRFNLDEANVTIEKLTLNERELRKSLDQSLNEKKNEEKEKIEAMSSNQVVLTEMRSSLLTKETELQISQNEITHLRKALDSANHHLKQKTDELVDEHSKVSSLSSQLQTKDDRFHQLKEDLMLENQRSYSQMQGRLNMLKQDKEQIERQKRLIEGQLADTRGALNRLKSESVEKEASLERQMEARLNETTIENCTLRNKVSQLETQLSNHQVELKETTRNLTHALELSDHKVELIRQENEALVKQYRTSEDANCEIKQKYDEINEKLEKSGCDLLGLQRCLDACRDKLVDEETEKNVFKVKLDKMTLEYERLEIASSNEREILQSDVTNLRSRLASMQKQMEDGIKEREIKFENDIKKEKRKTASYKEKAIDAYTKNLYAKQLLREHEKGI